jgi:hypothetical protein
MKDTPWDHGLRVTGDGEGLAGHAGAVLLRKLADRAGLTAALGSALARAGKFPLIDRGLALVSMAVAIALGATSMNDIALLAHQDLLFGGAPSDTTVRRTLELADARTLDKIARVRARVRTRARQTARRCGSPIGRRNWSCSRRSTASRSSGRSRGAQIRPRPVPTDPGDPQETALGMVRTWISVFAP